MLLLVGLAALLGGWIGNRSRPMWAEQAEKSAALHIAPEHLFAGTVRDDELLVMQIPITNRSEQDVLIEGFSKSCDCEEIIPERLTIPAGGVRTVRVKIDLSRKPDSAMKNNIFVTSISPRVLVPKQSKIEWKITGNVRSILEIAPRAMDLGEVNPQGGARNMCRTLRVRGPFRTINGINVRAEHDQLRLATKVRREDTG